jgi:hypothetical protein
MPRCVGIRWRRRATVRRIDLKETSWTFHSFTSRDELLSAVDALCRSCDRLVDHDVSGERGDVCRANTPPMGSVECSSSRRLSSSSPRAKLRLLSRQSQRRYHLDRWQQTFFATHVGLLARSQPRIIGSRDPTAVRRGVARVRGERDPTLPLDEWQKRSRRRSALPFTDGQAQARVGMSAALTPKRSGAAEGVGEGRRPAPVQIDDSGRRGPLSGS